MTYLLFTTTECPKCPAFKDFVHTYVHFDGEIIDQNDEHFFRLSTEYMVSSVPTIIIFEDEKREAVLLRTSEVTDLYDFIHSRSH